MGTGGKARPGCDADTPPPPQSNAEVVNEWELYILSPLRLHRCCGTALPFTFYPDHETLSGPQETNQPVPQHPDPQPMFCELLLETVFKY
jgi:hypothetical protein